MNTPTATPTFTRTTAQYAGIPVVIVYYTPTRQHAHVKRLDGETWVAGGTSGYWFDKTYRTNRRLVPVGHLRDMRTEAV